MTKTLYFFVSLLFFPLFLVSQTTVSGLITDAATNEPIPYANVFFVGNTSGNVIGTISDFDGNFTLKTSEKVDSISIQVLGYKHYSKKIVPRKKQTINFQLQAASFNLDDVTVMSSRNPAHRILKQVWESKKNFNPEKYEAYQHETYNRIEIAIDNLTEKFKESKTMKPFSDIFDSLKVAAGEDGKEVLPFFISETISDFYYRKMPSQEKEIIHANKFKGILMPDDGGELIQQFLGTSYAKFNFYNNWLSIFERNFISPIGKSGRMFYKYSLADSMYINGRHCYKITFKPKRKEDLAFNGTIWIQDSLWALKRVRVEVDKSANLNFVNRYKIEQDFEYLNDSIYLPSKIRVLVDFLDNKQGIGLIVKYNIANKNFVINQPKPLKFFDQAIEADFDAWDYNDDFWRQERIKRINDSTRVKANYAVIDSISQSSRLQSLTRFINFAIEGYLVTKYFEFGHYIYTLGYNEFEGFRMRLGGRSKRNLSKNLILKGYVAYGSKDNRLKYDAQAEYFLNKKKWRKIGIRRKYDYDRVGISDKFLSSHPYMSFVFAVSSQFGLKHDLILSETNSLWYESDLHRGFSHKLMFRNKNYKPVGGFAFAFFDKNGEKRDEFTTSEVSYHFRYAPREIFVMRDNYRAGIFAERGFVLEFDYAYGFKNFLNSDFDYHKVGLKMTHKMKLKALGRFRYQFTATKIWGALPYTLLNLVQANESVLSNPKSFNTMKFGEFVTDQSVELLLLNHFDGLILNRIPLIRRLKWRLVAGANMIWGTLSQKQLDLLPATDLLDRPLRSFKVLSSQEPFVEVFYGVENIFKFLRIQVFHRLNYLNSPDIQRFSIRGTILFTF